MKLTEILRGRPWLSPLVHLSNNPLSFLGVLLTTTGGITWLFILPAQFRGIRHPYLGILFFLFCPVVFFSGLALIPLGIWFRFRRQKARGELAIDFLPLDWRNPDFRRLCAFTLAATFANVVIGGNFTYTAVNYMDSASFCGQVCHSVMGPQFTAYQDSPHGRVACVECHIGGGASWFIRSKFSGVRQVFAVTFHRYPRPIPAPVQNLRPARETCESCHWPGKSSGYQLRLISKFASDEPNTPLKTVLLMKIGGGEDSWGIHGVHLGSGVRIEYASDASRQNIRWVRYTRSGQSTEYAAEGFTRKELPALQQRVMDCTDCHNRPGHNFEAPEAALDRALADGRIPATLPSIKKQGLQLLMASYGPANEVDVRVPAALHKFYAKQYPQIYQARNNEIRKAAKALLSIYHRNVFPEMRISWNTYRNQIGHTYFPGCFRCHDEEHKSVDGKAITQDCSACHQILAMDESNPEILKQLSVP
jgi:hypothetical protein